MRQVLVVALFSCLVLATQLTSSEAQFSFSLPGRWGNGKRAAWSQGGNGECAEFNAESLLNIYRAIQVCIRKKILVHKLFKCSQLNNPDDVRTYVC